MRLEVLKDFTFTHSFQAGVTLLRGGKWCLCSVFFLVLDIHTMLQYVSAILSPHMYEGRMSSFGLLIS